MNIVSSTIRDLLIVAEKEYNALQKAKRNEEYLAMIDKSLAEAETGNIILACKEHYED